MIRQPNLEKIISLGVREETHHSSKFFFFSSLTAPKGTKLDKIKAIKGHTALYMVVELRFPGSRQGTTEEALALC